MRLFLAINLPSAARTAVYAATAALRECTPELAWVPASNIHLTMKFLDDQPAERLADIQAAVAGVAARHRELVMTLGGVGAFPNFRRARVVWLGVAQEARLELLHHDVEVACASLGVEIEGRPFRPHLTLARVTKRPLAEDRWRTLARAARRIDYRDDCIVRSIDLMQSELSAAGARYTTLLSAALRSD